MGENDQIIKKRDSNFELLRILCMFIIILNHSVTHGKLGFPRTGWLYNRVGSEFFSFGQLGVSCFVLITGYYQCNSSFKLKRIVYLWFEIVFYSVVIFGICIALGFETWSREGLLRAIMPVLNRNYWFLTAYIGLYICTPALNAMIGAMDRRLHLTAIWTGIVMFSVVPTVWGSAVWGDDRFIWFFILYLIGAYLRKYPSAKVLQKKTAVTGFVVTLLLIWFSKLVMDYFTMYDASYIRYINYATNSVNKTPVLAASVFLFAIFANMKVEQSEWINYFASSMLGVYILHDNYYVRDLLWVRLFTSRSYIYKPSFLFYLVGISFFVLVAALLIDKTRIFLIQLVKKIDKMELPQQK